MCFRKIKKVLGVMNEDTSPDERNIRELLADEQNAVRKYEEFAVSSDNEQVKRVLLDIAEEEKVHAGELRELLSILGLGSTETDEKGKQEVDDLLT